MSAGRSFLFVRHGETDWNFEGRLQGQKDIPLNRRGERQAVAAGLRVGRILRERGLTAADLQFVVSPLGRTRDTAERLRAVLGLRPHDYRTDARLAEFSFGTFEGLTWAEVKARHPEAKRLRRLDKWAYVPPGGESYAMLAERVRPWLESADDTTLAISHGGVARVLMVLIGGVSPVAAVEAPVPQGRVLVFQGNGFAWR